MYRSTRSLCLSLLFLLGLFDALHAQQSIARQWNEVNLEAVKHNGSRPTVIARTLFHHSMAMYDCWAVYDSIAETVLLGKSLGEVAIPFDGVPMPTDVEAARHEAISYASYRLLMHRYERPPGEAINLESINDFMLSLGYDPEVTSTDYSTGDPAHLGNYVGTQLIDAALQDGSNEVFNYSNTAYLPVNTPLDMRERGNPDVDDLDRFQQLQIVAFWDASCGQMFAFPHPFLSPEWVNVVPFALDTTQAVQYSDERGDWRVYLDAGPGPLLSDAGGSDALFKWSHEIVGMWSRHHDPSDATVWDTSPASIGNLTIDEMPQTIEEYAAIYDFIEGGANSPGHAINPATGAPYAPQLLSRRDYVGATSAFWAGGWDRKGAAAIWFSLYNEASDHPLFSRQWTGSGPELTPLDYDVWAYLALGGAMHDAAIAAWSNKGYYDSPRPVAVLRGLVDIYGQCTDATLDNYHPKGIDLIPGYIEVIGPDDALVTDSTQYLIGEIKMKTWLGSGELFPCYPGQDEGMAPLYNNEISGAGWRPLKDWWPFQQPQFVSPPYAGHVSAQSALASAGAEVMTAITGDPYFPGGLATFVCEADSFIPWEVGPSEEVVLQWATYRDAAAQCGLSRIWSGVGTPTGDLLGQQMGQEVGPLAVDSVNALLGIDQVAPLLVEQDLSDDVITDADAETTVTYTLIFSEAMDTEEPLLITLNPEVDGVTVNSSQWEDSATLEVLMSISDEQSAPTHVDLLVEGAQDMAGNQVEEQLIASLYVDMENPTAQVLLTENELPEPTFRVDCYFDEPMDTTAVPILAFSEPEVLSNSLSLSQSVWVDNAHYSVVYALVDAGEEYYDLGLTLSGGLDSLGNEMLPIDTANVLTIDDRRPEVTLIAVSAEDVTDQLIGENTFAIQIDFDEPMDTTMTPIIGFPVEDPIAQALVPDLAASSWLSPEVYEMRYDVLEVSFQLLDIDVSASEAVDRMGNVQVSFVEEDLFDIHLNFISVDELGSLAVMQVYPNPLSAGQELLIELGEEIADLRISILDLRGRVVWAEERSNVAQQTALSIPDIGEGTYLLMLEGEGRRSSVKLQIGE